MKTGSPLKLPGALVMVLMFNLEVCSQVHEVSFCGEKIPLARKHVSIKLMDVIRKQIPYVNLPELRKRAKAYLPGVELYLRRFGLPEDLKYLAIVESGFASVTSSAGARGAWQLMPVTAREKGLLVSEFADDRDNLDKSTRAACYLLAEYYTAIQKKFKVSSWVLTAAAYNVGIGNIQNTIMRQGADYFSMQLNAETATYVYKIIAVKELFEYPEFYLKDFSENIFALSTIHREVTAPAQDSDFSKLELTIPTGKAEGIKKPDFRMIGAIIKGNYKTFKDRDLVKIMLLETFELKGMFRSKGAIFQGTGWIVDDKVFVDLGFNNHDVQLYDRSGNAGIASQGIALNLLKNNEPVLLRVLQE